MPSRSRLLSIFAVFAVMNALVACNGNSGGKNLASGTQIALLGSDWQVQAVGRLRADPAADQQSWLRIEQSAEQTSVDGNTGCNSMRGSAELNGSKLSFGPIATTKRFCPQTAGIESALLGALKEVRSWSLSGEQLELRNEAGATVVTLGIKPATP